MDDAKKGANAVMTIDLEKPDDLAPGRREQCISTSMPFRKHCLLNGLDDIGLTEQKDRRNRRLRGRRRGWPAPGSSA